MEGGRKMLRQDLLQPDICDHYLCFDPKLSTSKIRQLQVKNTSIKFSTSAFLSQHLHAQGSR